MINQVVIDGYIGKELELKTTQSLKISIQLKSRKGRKWQAQ